MDVEVMRCSFMFSASTRHRCSGSSAAMCESVNGAGLMGSRSPSSASVLSNAASIAATFPVASDRATAPSSMYVIASWREMPCRCCF